MNKELYDEAIRSNILSRKLIEQLMESMKAPIFLPILQVRSLMLLIRQRKYIFLWKPPKTDMPTIWLWQVHQRTKHISGFPVSANAFH